MSPMAATTTTHERLDAHRKTERCGQDQIAEAISLHLYETDGKE